jgi:hypothetical protein
MDISMGEMHRILALLVAGGLVFGGPARADDIEDEARDHFLQGVALYQDENYEGALVEFETSFEMNANWKVHYNLGLAFQAMHMYVEAEVHFKAYLSKGMGQLDSERMAEVNDVLLDLASVIGEVEVECDVEGADVYLDGKKVATTPVEQPIRANVGKYDVEVKKSGFEDFSLTVTVPGKAKVSVNAVLVQIPVEQQPDEAVIPDDGQVDDGTSGRKKIGKGAFVAGLTITVLAGVAAITTGVLTLKKNERFYDTDYSDTVAWQDLRTSGKKLALATDVLLGVTAAAAIFTIVVAVFTDFRGGTEKKDLALSPMLGPGVLGLGLTAAFGGV